MNNKPLTMPQLTTRWETIWARYIKALTDMDEVKQHKYLTNSPTYRAAKMRLAKAEKAVQGFEKNNALSFDFLLTR